MNQFRSILINKDLCRSLQIYVGSEADPASAQLCELVQLSATLVTLRLDRPSTDLEALCLNWCPSVYAKCHRATESKITSPRHQIRKSPWLAEIPAPDGSQELMQLYRPKVWTIQVAVHIYHFTLFSLLADDITSWDRSGAQIFANAWWNDEITIAW